MTLPVSPPTVPRAAHAALALLSLQPLPPPARSNSLLNSYSCTPMQLCCNLRQLHGHAAWRYSLARLYSSWTGRKAGARCSGRTANRTVSNVPTGSHCAVVLLWRGHTRSGLERVVGTPLPTYPWERRELGGQEVAPGSPVPALIQVRCGSPAGTWQSGCGLPAGLVQHRGSVFMFPGCAALVQRRRSGTVEALVAPVREGGLLAPCTRAMPAAPPPSQQSSQVSLTQAASGKKP